MKRLAFGRCRPVRWALLGFIAPWLTACVGFMPPALEESDDLPPAVATRPSGQSGGLFSPATTWSLISDQRAFRPGDVLTVRLDEQTQASKRSGTSYGKRSGVDVDGITLLGKKIDSDSHAGAKRDFKGDSASSLQNTLRGALTVVVQEVLPNGLLRVRGEKRLYLNQGEETVRLAGYVRAGDIDTDNRVSSQRIANARIQYFGTGTLADAGNPGWLSRFFNSPLMPF